MSGFVSSKEELPSNIPLLMSGFIRCSHEVKFKVQQKNSETRVGFRREIERESTVGSTCWTWSRTVCAMRWTETKRSQARNAKYPSVDGAGGKKVLTPCFLCLQHTLYGGTTVIFLKLYFDSIFVDVLVWGSCCNPAEKYDITSCDFRPIKI